ncbi:acyl-CoA thioesterase [Citrifermentans bemidjiense Bem]|uniref:Acyl-CoA thioesterase n=1 Tax=Citrifermentans bemidjiense (strain ATCC BAA-1014 / DSM 16622 / JCM 12645 / Bem) TaxID=404380 RepID=B5ECX4_CITBB|nr:acyl-CoA thioesterase [Citrifermentans bemidjiense]ACH40591.1 acyl-CoA thioesterase [Citrifermentans bemidjiense Bem]
MSDETNKNEVLQLTPHETRYLFVLPFSTDRVLARRFLAKDGDMPGNIRFGKLLEVLDKVAENTALGYVNQFYPDARVVTAAIDNIVVRNPADTTHDLVFSAQINHVGKSSMEVGIRVECLGTCSSHLASCYFTMVARSADSKEAKSLTLPPLDYRQPVEQKRHQKAEQRRQAYRESLVKAEEMPSLEEYLLLKKLHKEQESVDFDGVRAGSLVLESALRAYPEQENVPKTIFGGYLTRKAYELAALAAEMVTPNRVVPCQVNRINFNQPVLLGDQLKFTARVVFTGKTTITVQSDIERFSRDAHNKALSNSCLFTFRNVGNEMEPMTVPFIYPVTYAEDARFLNAYRQRVD